MAHDGVYHHQSGLGWYTPRGAHREGRDCLWLTVNIRVRGVMRSSHPERSTRPLQPGARGETGTRGRPGGENRPPCHLKHPPGSGREGHGSLERDEIGQTPMAREDITPFPGVGVAPDTPARGRRHSHTCAAWVRQMPAVSSSLFGAR